MAHIGLRIDDDLLDRVDEQLDYGDSRSEWIREAIRQRLNQVEDETDTP